MQAVEELEADLAAMVVGRPLRAIAGDFFETEAVLPTGGSTGRSETLVQPRTP